MTELTREGALDEGQVRSFDPVTLQELNDRAALPERIDRKYLVTEADVTALLEHMHLSGARCLEIGARRGSSDTCPTTLILRIWSSIGSQLPNAGGA